MRRQIKTQSRALTQGTFSINCKQNAITYGLGGPRVRSSGVLEKKEDQIEALRRCQHQIILICARRTVISLCTARARFWQWSWTAALRSPYIHTAKFPPCISVRLCSGDNRFWRHHRQLQQEPVHLVPGLWRIECFRVWSPFERRAAWLGGKSAMGLLPIVWTETPPMRCDALLAHFAQAAFQDAQPSDAHITSIIRVLQSVLAQRFRIANALVSAPCLETQETSRAVDPRVFCVPCSTSAAGHLPATYQRDPWQSNIAKEPGEVVMIIVG